MALPALSIGSATWSREEKGALEKRQGRARFQHAQLDASQRLRGTPAALRRPGPGAVNACTVGISKNVTQKGALEEMKIGAAELKQPLKAKYTNTHPPPAPSCLIIQIENIPCSVQKYDRDLQMAKK